MPTLALFGTSADPPTQGHQRILHWLAEHYDQVAVWASDNPFKSHRTVLPHREEMLRLLIEEIPEPWRRRIALYPQLSYPRTLLTLEKARQQWPQAEFTLVIGSDLIRQIPSWYQAKELLAQVKLMVIPRPGYPVQDEALLPLRDLGAIVAIAAVKGLAVSSTAYRDEHNPDVLTPAIQNYIQREQLYSCEGRASEKVPIQSPLNP